MRRVFLRATAGLAVCLALIGGRAAQADDCGNYGTTVDFYSSPNKAAAAAKKEQKLVMVLHISGVFEDRNLT